MGVRTPWFGLRAQIVLAVGLLFLLSLWLLGFATVQIARRNAGSEHAGREQLLARALAPSWQQLAAAGPAAVSGACTELRARVAGVALELQLRDGTRLRCGATLATGHGSVQLPTGERLRVQLPDGSDQGSRRLARLLLFYLALTGFCVALFTYVLLTHLIVRPLERLTSTAEQFAQGALHLLAEERGSAEAVRLARTFNRMATLLRAERKALTDRLAELTRTTHELESTQRQLIHGEKLASVGRLAAGVAHEIGNPLTAIAGLVELLRSGDLSEAQTREFLARIAGETERVDGIIRDLLDFARQESPRDELQQRCDLRSAIEDAVSLLRPQKASREVHIDVGVSPELGEVVGARAKHTQVLLNLLMNALDALQGRAGQIQIRAQQQDERSVLLWVQDDGPGIPTEIAEHLFEPFCTTKPPGQGTGLGLAVSHTIVESLGGSIRAYNAAQGGACFELRLPLAPAQAAPAQATQAARAAV